MTFIPRRISSSILRVPKNKAVELFGMRQVGKTTLLEHLFKNHRTAWYTGDSPDDVRILTSLPSANELRTLIANYEFIVIDEAQRIPLYRFAHQAIRGLKDGLPVNRYRVEFS